MDLALLHFEDSDTAVPPPVRLKTPPAAKERAQVITAPYRDGQKNRCRLDWLGYL